MLIEIRYLQHNNDEEMSYADDTPDNYRYLRSKPH